MFSKINQAIANHRKGSNRPVYVTPITPDENDPASYLHLTWDELHTLSTGGSVERICPAHYEDLIKESLTVTLVKEVLLLSCDQGCSRSDIIAALKAGRGERVKPARTASDADLAEIIGLTETGLRRLEKGESLMSVCPVHQQQYDLDNMMIRLSNTGGLLFKCFQHCSTDSIVSTLRANAGRR
jgi:hypothetical protein